MDLSKEKEAPNNTPAETVIGWLTVFFSVLVMAFGFNNCQVNVVFWVGVALVPIGIVFIAIGKQKQKNSKACSSGK